MSNLSEFTKNGLSVQVTHTELGNDIFGSHKVIVARQKPATHKTWPKWEQVPMTILVGLIPRAKGDNSKNAEIYFDLIS